MFKVHKGKGPRLLSMIIIISMAVFMNGCAKNVPKDVVAKVNDEDIRKEQYDKEYGVYKKLYVNQMGEEIMDQVDAEGELYKDTLQKEVLAKLILEKIILQDSQKQGIEVEDKELDAYINDMKESMGGEKQLNEFIKSIGMDEDHFRKNTKRDLLIEKHKSKFIKDIDLEDKEIEKFFNEKQEELTVIKARHILLETEEEAKAILGKLEDGEDFEELAMENSIDEESLELGGELGYFSRGYNPEEFDKVVFSLKEGQISPLIKTVLGYHIVEVQEKKDTLESLRPEIIVLMEENKYDDYVKKLEDESDIEKYLEEDKK